MKKSAPRTNKRLVRRIRIRARLSGDAKRPRLSIFRSNRGMFAQLIDDTKGATIVSASDKALTAAEQKKGKLERAIAVGALVATRAKEKKITHAVFDRGGFRYTGRVKALADGARKAGLIF